MLLRHAGWGLEAGRRLVRGDRRLIAHWLLVAHIVVLGYWLGTELVINSTYRYVAYGERMPFDERTRLMEHVMDADQHVRYALVLQAGLGTAIAALYGYFPGGANLAIAAGVIGALWLIFVEVVHRLRHERLGSRLATVDRGSRYVLMALFLALAVGLIGPDWPMPPWLRWKVGLFAAAMMCGVGIRYALIDHFRTWAIMERDGPTPETNAIIRRTYVRGTSVLVLLWVFITAIVLTSVIKPT
jgi:predicted outer membrane lipoprotein